ELRGEIARCRIIGSREPRAPARPPALGIRHRLRRGGARRRPPRLRRPPGAAWLGAAIHACSMGAVGVSGAYQAVLWIAWLLPGFATFVLLTRLFGSGWLALPGAFVALTLSAGSRSG